MHRFKTMLAVLFGAASFVVRAASPAATQEWVKNYIEDEGLTELHRIVESILATSGGASTDDEVGKDDDGFFVTNTEIRDGVVTNVKYRVELEVVKSTPTTRVPGARVVRSTNPEIAKNSILAKNGTQYGNHFANLPGGFAFVLTETDATDWQGDYKRWDANGYYENAANSPNGIIITQHSITGTTVGRFLELTERLVVSNETTRATLTNATWAVTVDGIVCGDDEHRACWGYGFNFATPDTWHTQSGETLTKYAIKAMQKVETARFVPFSPLRLFIGTAFADQGTIRPVMNTLPILDAPMCDMVDSFAFAMNGETSETHTADPSEVPDPNQWNDPNRWFSSFPASPFPLVITVEITQPSGQVVQKEMKIRNLDKLKELGVAILSKEWNPPKFTKKLKDCERGHVYGKDCKCIVCGAQRAHAWGWEESGMDECAKCMNEFDTFTEDRNGVKIPDGGTTGEKCLHKCTDGDELWHRVWHHTAVEDTDDFSCDCQCGYYKYPNRRHAHDFSDENTIEEWRDSGDGVHHEAELECHRACGKVKKVKNKHEADTTAPLPDGEVREYRKIPVKDSEGRDSFDIDYHLTQGVCQANGCGFVGWMREKHDLGSGSEACYCADCEEYFHDMITVGCGGFVNRYCVRCAYGYNENADRHDFSHAKPGDWEKHTCACGLEKHRHHFDGQRRCVGGETADGKEIKGDGGCGYIKKKNDGGHACPLGALGGHGDDDDKHRHNDGRNNLRGSCPCGTTIGSIYPNYDPMKPAQAALYNGVAQYAVGGTGGYCESWIDEKLAPFLYYSRKGDSANFHLWLNGHETHTPFWADPTIILTNVVYDIMIDRYGTVDEENGKSFIKW